MKITSLIGLELNALDVMIITHLPYSLQQKINKRRLNKIIKYARNNSSYYHDIIPDNFSSLNDIPVTTKSKMMENYNQIVTDHRITKDFVIEQMTNNPDTHKILGKYSLAASSGSTGNPVLCLQDNSMSQRLFVSLINYCHFPCAMLCRPGYGIFNVAHDSNSASKLVSLLSKTYSSLLPPTELAKQFNKDKPRAIMSYGSLLGNVADIADDGLLKINPKVIMASGDRLSPSCRNRLAKHYPKAQILACYACTEGGVLAVECSEGHMHVREDMVEIQPLNEKWETLPDGVTSDYVAITNYFNFVQPVIRYVLDDRIVMHHGCSCGNKSPWIELEGRSAGQWNFVRLDGTVQKVSTLVMLNIIHSITDDTLHYFSKYQLVFHEGNENLIEFRLNLYPDVTKEETLGLIEKSFNDYLVPLNIKAKYVIADIPPQITTHTGKLKCFLVEKDGRIIS